MSESREAHLPRRTCEHGEWPRNGHYCSQCFPYSTPKVEAPTPQAPVAGADPRADGWRALADAKQCPTCHGAKERREGKWWVRCATCDGTGSPDKAIRAALRDAAEANHALRVAQLVNLREIADLRDERDAAAEAVTEANAIADKVIRERDEAREARDLAQRRHAADARGAEGERRRDVAEEAVARVRELASMAPGAARVMGLAAILADYDATLAPRASAGPAAWEEGPSGFDVGPVAYTNADALRDGLAARERAREREGAARASDADVWNTVARAAAGTPEWVSRPVRRGDDSARASDDPAPTTEVEPVEMLYAMAGVVGTCRLCGKRLSNGGHMTAHGEAHVRKGEARHVGNPFGFAECRYALTAAAPAAPEVPRG